MAPLHDRACYQYAPFTSQVAAFIALEPRDTELLVEMVGVIKGIAEQLLAEHGGCQVSTNLGDYQTNKHLHWHISAGPPLR